MRFISLLLKSTQAIVNNMFFLNLLTLLCHCRAPQKYTTAGHNWASRIRFVQPPHYNLLHLLLLPQNPFKYVSIPSDTENHTQSNTHTFQRRISYSPSASDLYIENRRTRKVDLQTFITPKTPAANYVVFFVVVVEGQTPNGFIWLFVYEWFTQRSTTMFRFEKYKTRLSALRCPKNKPPRCFHYHRNAKMRSGGRCERADQQRAHKTRPAIRRRWGLAVCVRVWLRVCSLDVALLFWPLVGLFHRKIRNIKELHWYFLRPIRKNTSHKK